MAGTQPGNNTAPNNTSTCTLRRKLDEARHGTRGPPVRHATISTPATDGVVSSREGRNLDMDMDMNMEQVENLNMNMKRNYPASGDTQAAGSLTHLLPPSSSSWPPAAAIGDIPSYPTDLNALRTTGIPTLGGTGDFSDFDAELDFSVKPGPFLPPAHWAAMPGTARNLDSTSLDLALGIAGDDFDPFITPAHDMEEPKAYGWDNVLDMTPSLALRHTPDSSLPQFPPEFFSMDSPIRMNNMPALYMNDSGFDLTQPSTDTGTAPRAIPSCPEVNAISSSNTINSISSQVASSDSFRLDNPPRGAAGDNGGPFSCQSPWPVAGSPDLSLPYGLPGPHGVSDLSDSYREEFPNSLAIGLLNNSLHISLEEAAREFMSDTGATVSPKDLNIEPSPRHFSSSESMSMLARFNDMDGSSVGSVDGGAGDIPWVFSAGPVEVPRFPGHRTANNLNPPLPTWTPPKQPPALRTQAYTSEHTTTPRPKYRKQQPDRAPPKPRSPSVATGSNGAVASAKGSNMNTKTHGRHSQRPVHPSPYPPPSVTRRSPSTNGANLNTSKPQPSSTDNQNLPSSSSHEQSKSSRSPGSPTRTPRRAHRYGDDAPAAVVILPKHDADNDNENNDNENSSNENRSSSSKNDKETKGDSEKKGIDKNALLLKLRQELKMTYKEIKIVGEFTEPESTLRGRFRTLSKEQKMRVRKPQWTDKDIRLLERGVREHLPAGADLRHATGSIKIPWKKVAEYIKANGGTYTFGNSTCRKRWDELVAEQVYPLGNDIRRPFWG
ncbi:hypothetical protein B0T22DRAFT_484299 [Podospora appendiculata]|uniref:Myb-like domain-containing protein n=1 Tax=Podospora appendiculata TaxID=314037 RepID=A0AAE1C7Z1_9PEZI|nr:hypothetical protein B0T22DRAFT_484299 [Podospora appendiculata]